MTVTLSSKYKAASITTFILIILYNMFSDSEYFDFIQVLGQIAFVQIIGTIYYLIGWRR